MVLVTCTFFSLSAIAAERDTSPKTEAAKKIVKLKAELATAKGQKRVKLIKKIAEIENKVLEHKLQSIR